ncbi:MFS transporter [Labedaea rhizosphaerae]|uniref:Putative MFS transporter n=1 Tax=Labedaea rhizosphaerae TaxID=598644 RepID=A0A4R6SGB0_LABRH|nr:MFS transporter [Labedaea rhizosphaerae]TDQ00550.1 putative MFS transporter [Labedaea rhizosphaerae]
MTLHDTNADRGVDVSVGQLLRALDRSRMTAKHVGLYVVSALGHFFDGYDVQVIGVILPAITLAFHLPAGQAGVLGSSTAFGMLFGAICVGFVSDRIGRKSALMLALGVFALFSLLSAFPPNFGWLVTFRVLTGVGLGAEVVTMYAYISEFLPARLRGTLLTTSSMFWQLASVVAAVLAIVVVPAFGWQGMFVIGALPAVVVVVIWRMLPESVRFLVAHDKLSDATRIVRDLSSVDPKDVPADTDTKAAAETAESVKQLSVSDLFRGKFARLTPGVWLIQFFNGFVLFSIVTWLPSILVAKGFTFVHSLLYVAVIVGVGAFGNVGAGLVLNRIGRRKAMLLFFVLGGITLMIWGVQSTGVGILVLGAISSFFIYGVSGAVYTYTSEIYPTTLRATGTGWSGGAQRVGAIVAPSVIGWMIGSHLPIISVFILLAVGFIVAAVAVLFLTHETGSRTLEEIEASVIATR